MTTRKKAKKSRKSSVSDRLTGVENALTFALETFAEFKKMLGTEAITLLTKRVENLENLFKPELNALLGELRAVRYLLDDKKQYAHMDKPRPPLEASPIPERVL